MHAPIWATPIPPYYCADVINRYHRMVTDETFFLTGTDEHGDKIMRAAKKENMTPRAYVDKISALFRELWPQMNIANDHFIRTTDPGHVRNVVQIILQKSTIRATSTSATMRACTASAVSGSTRSGSWWTGNAPTTAPSPR